MNITSTVIGLLLSIILLLPAAVFSGNSNLEPNGILETVEEAKISNLGVVRVGTRIHHPNFGTGKVISIMPGDGVTAINVMFEKEGEKWLMAEHAMLKVVSE